MRNPLKLLRPRQRNEVDGMVSADGRWVRRHGAWWPTPFGGAVDIIIQNSTTIQRTETFPFDTIANTVFLEPTFDPIESVVTLSGFDTDNNAETWDGPPSGVGVGDDYRKNFRH